MRVALDLCFCCVFTLYVTVFYIYCIVDDADDKLFRDILSNPHHTLYQLLPEQTSHKHQLRTRRHDRQLRCKSKFDTVVLSPEFRLFKNCYLPYLIIILHLVSSASRHVLFYFFVFSRNILVIRHIFNRSYFCTTMLVCVCQNEHDWLMIDCIMFVLRRDFGKSNNLYISGWLVCCSTCSQSKSRLVTKRKQNDITLLNKFLLITNFIKTCIKALYMRHNNCLTRKLSHSSTQTDQLRTCNAVCNAYGCSNICIRSHSWNSSRSWLTCSSNRTQTRLCLTVNTFSKSRLFANMFKLFDLPKSRLYLTKKVRVGHRRGFYAPDKPGHSYA